MAKNSGTKSSNLKLIPPGKRATSYDVAQHAGVSQSAVSRCFKPGASVSAKTRAKVEKAAKKLGYQPNAIARGLITRRSNMVAVIINNLTNLNYPEVLSQLSACLEERNIRILLFTLGRESDVDQALEKVWQYQVDGIIAAAQLSNGQIQACETRQIPVVFYNRIYEESSISTVCCDHAEGERRLINGLLADGRRSFMVMSGPSDSAVSTARTTGALNRLGQEEVNFVEVEGDYSYDRAVDVIHDLMAGNSELPDAIVCANDTMAMGCVDCLRHEYGIKVPDRVAVVGFDGAGSSTWLSYDLTTVVQPVERMVSAAVSMICERVETPNLPAEKRMFAGELRLGGSARFP